MNFLKRLFNKPRYILFFSRQSGLGDEDLSSIPEIPGIIDTKILLDDLRQIAVFDLKKGEIINIK